MSQVLPAITTGVGRNSQSDRNEARENRDQQPARQERSSRHQSSRRRITNARPLLLGLGGFMVAIAAWAILEGWLVENSAFPGPLEVVGALMVSVSTVSFWQAVWVTLIMSLKGLAIAVLIGVPVGLAIGLSPIFASATRVPLEFIKPIPPIVIMPTAIMVLGPTQQMGEFLIIFGCAIPIIYQTANGVKEVDPVALDTGRSFGMRRPEIILRIVLPSASAFIGTAIRIAMPISLMVAVVAGLLGGSPGLGSDLSRSVVSGDQAYMYALVIVLGVMGVMVNFLGECFERLFLHWHPSFRSEAI